MFKNLQIPRKICPHFKNFTLKAIKCICKKIYCERQKLKSDFEKFLYKKLYDFLPMSYLENFMEILSITKNIRKRIFYNVLCTLE